MCDALEKDLFKPVKELYSPFIQLINQIINKEELYIGSLINFIASIFAISDEEWLIVTHIFEDFLYSFKDKINLGSIFKEAVLSWIDNSVSQMQESLLSIYNIVDVVINVL